MTEEIYRRELPSDKRILIDEIYKILYFNNQDPETVWSLNTMYNIFALVQHSVLG